MHNKIQVGQGCKMLGGAEHCGSQNDSLLQRHICSPTKAYACYQAINNGATCKTLPFPLRWCQTFQIMDVAFLILAVIVGGAVSKEADGAVADDGAQSDAQHETGD